MASTGEEERSSGSGEPPAKRQKKEEAQKPATCNDEALRILFRYVDFPAHLRLVCKHWNKIYMEGFVLSENVLREMCSYPQQPTKLDPNRARKAILWLSGLATQYNRDLQTMFATRETRQLLIRARYDLSGVEPRQLVSFSYSPYDITIFNDSLFVCDYASHLRSYSLSNDFQLVRTFAFDHAPFSIACDSSTGNVLVCFRDRHCIRIYKPTGAFIRELGSHGEGPDQLRYPRGIAAKDGLVYVADGENARVSVFSANGVFFQHIGLNQLTSPHSLDLDDEGRLFVTDSAHKVFVFSTVNGALLYSFGDRGLGFGEFNYPRGIAIDKLGNILVCDCDNCRIQVFDSNGQFLHSFGCRDDHSGKPGSLSYPSFISIDSSGNVFVSEWSMKRIQMF